MNLTSEVLIVLVSFLYEFRRKKKKKLEQTSLQIPQWGMCRNIIGKAVSGKREERGAPHGWRPPFGLFSRQGLTPGQLGCYPRHATSLLTVLVRAPLGWYQILPSKQAGNFHLMVAKET